MNAIVVVDNNWGIGKDNDLLTHLPGDLKYFKQMTSGNVIVYGRKTLESFPGGNPLPNRTNIVLTSNPNFKNDKCIVCCGVENLLDELKKYDSDTIFVAGGESVYELLLDRCTTVYVTKMYKTFEADKHFPNLDERVEFTEVDSSELQEENGVQYRFLKYIRK